MFVCLFFLGFFQELGIFLENHTKHSKTANVVRNYHAKVLGLLVFVIILLILPFFKISKIVNLWGKFVTIVTFITKKIAPQEVKVLLAMTL